MDTPFATVVDLAAGTEIQTPLNGKDLKAHQIAAEAAAAKIAADQTAAAEAAAAKQAILDRLGLTAEEAKMLLS